MQPKRRRRPGDKGGAQAQDGSQQQKAAKEEIDGIRDQAQKIIAEAKVEE